MWLLWKEQNIPTSEDTAMTEVDLESLFFLTLFSWSQASSFTLDFLSIQLIFLCNA